MQLQTFTAVVKLFLYKSDSSQGLVQRILNTATKDCDSPDVRDRAYIFWCILSTDTGAAKVWGPTFMTLFGFLLMRFSAACHSCTSSANILTSHYCCARATQRVNWGDLKPRKRLSETGCNFHRSRAYRRGVNAVHRDRVSRSPYLGALLGLNVGIFSLVDLTKTALQTVAAGQAAENLLDFDDEPA